MLFRIMRHSLFLYFLEILRTCAAERANIVFRK